MEMYHNDKLCLSINFNYGKAKLGSCEGDISYKAFFINEVEKSCEKGLGYQVYINFHLDDGDNCSS